MTALTLNTTQPAISVPDDTFEKAIRRALGLVVDALAGGDDSASDAVGVALRLLGETSGDW